MPNKINLSGNANKSVFRESNYLVRKADGCSVEIHRFLGYLERLGLPVEHPISITNGNELYEYIDAEMVHPNKWSDEALFEIGKLTGELHKAGHDYIPENHDSFRPWCLREIGKSECIWCHGDIAPWNMMTKNGMPHKLIDWEYSGPLDPIVELARICWLFVQLHDDDLAAMYDLPSPEIRAKQVRLICDGYGLDL